MVPASAGGRRVGAVGVAVAAASSPAVRSDDFPQVPQHRIALQPQLPTQRWSMTNKLPEYSMRALVLAAFLSLPIVQGCQRSNIETADAIEATFDSDGTRIHYVERGRGDPVILIHGFLVESRWN